METRGHSVRISSRFSQDFGCFSGYTAVFVSEVSGFTATFTDVMKVAVWSPKHLNSWVKLGLEHSLKDDDSSSHSGLYKSMNENASRIMACVHHMTFDVTNNVWAFMTSHKYFWCHMTRLANMWSLLTVLPRVWSWKREKGKTEACSTTTVQATLQLPEVPGWASSQDRAISSCQQDDSQEHRCGVCAHAYSLTQPGRPFHRYEAFTRTQGHCGDDDCEQEILLPLINQLNIIH